MVKTTTESVTPTTIEQALQNDEITGAINRGIFRITQLRKPSSVLTGAASRDRLDWQDLYSKVVEKLTDPAVGFGATSFSPAFAYGVAKNTSAEWLRELVRKERPRTKQVSEEEETMNSTFPTQFDPKLEPKHQQEPDQIPDAKGLKGWEDFLDECHFAFLRDVLKRFAELWPDDHEWLTRYISERRVQKHTPADHQRAARLCRKVRELYDEMDAEFESDAEECSRLEEAALKLEAA